MRIALLEDDPIFGPVYVSWLKEAGHACDLFPTGQALMQALVRESYDMLILDWLLPDTTGDAMFLWTRQNVQRRVPILFITGRDTEEDIMRGLELGADDYLCKPLRHGEFVARVAAVGRRAEISENDTEIVIDAPPYGFNTVTRTLTCRGKPVRLTGKEFDLAVFLFRNRGRAVSRGHILQGVWGHEPGLTTRTVDTHVSRLRNKLHLTPERGWSLTPLYNYGYRLDAQTTDDAGQTPGRGANSAQRRREDDPNRPLRRRDDPRNGAAVLRPHRRATSG